MFLFRAIILFIFSVSTIFGNGSLCFFCISSFARDVLDETSETKDIRQGDREETREIQCCQCCSKKHVVHPGNHNHNHKKAVARESAEQKPAPHQCQRSSQVMFWDAKAPSSKMEVKQLPLLLKHVVFFDVQNDSFALLSSWLRCSPNRTNLRTALHSPLAMECRLRI